MAKSSRALASEPLIRLGGRDSAEVIESTRSLDAMHEPTASKEVPEPKALYRWRCDHMGLHADRRVPKLPFLAEQIERNQLPVFNWFYDHHFYGGRELPARWHEQSAQTLADGTGDEAASARLKHLHNRLEELMLSLERFLLIDEPHLPRASSALQRAAAQSKAAGRKIDSPLYHL